MPPGCAFPATSLPDPHCSPLDIHVPLIAVALYWHARRLMADDPTPLRLARIAHKSVFACPDYQIGLNW